MKIEKYNEYNETAGRHVKNYEFFKQKIFPYTLRWEGGARLHKVKEDRGGWTAFGIAYEKNKDLFTSLEDFQSLRYVQAALIAYVRYYRALRCDLAPVGVQLVYFDMGYHLGTTRTILYMQRCIGVKEDGMIGPVTRSKMKSLKKTCLQKRRELCYAYLKKRNEKNKRFYRGWMNRAEDIFKVRMQEE